VSEVIIPVAARRNSSRLVRELEGTVPRRNLQHGPHALRKSLLEGMWEKWQDKLEVTCLNHFRDVSDIEPVWLHNGYALNLKEAVIGPACSYKYVLMDSPNALLQLEGLLHRRDRDIFCLNDGVGDTEDVEMDDQERAKLYKSFLSGYFPTRSRFEKHSDED
jgi:hypothetical protein